MSDPIEYELRALEINIQEVEKKIQDLGGKLLGKQNFRRYVFDTLPAQKGKWLRLRTDGEQTTLTLKVITSDQIDGTAEWEVTVDDFETAYEIMTGSGFMAKGYQENERIEYSLDGARLALDSWPLIPPYLEIEADDEKTVLKCASTLGYDKSELTGLNTQKIYAQYGFDLDQISDLRFVAS